MASNPSVEHISKMLAGFGIRRELIAEIRKYLEKCANDGNETSQTESPLSAKEFWPCWHRETYGESVEQYMPIDGWKRVAFKFAEDYHEYRLGVLGCESK